MRESTFQKRVSRSSNASLLTNYIEGNRRELLCNGGTAVADKEIEEGTRDRKRRIRVKEKVAK